MHGEENSFISQKFKTFLMAKSSCESDFLVTEKLKLIFLLYFDSRIIISIAWNLVVAPLL